MTQRRTLRSLITSCPQNIPHGTGKQVPDITSDPVTNEEARNRVLCACHWPEHALTHSLPPTNHTQPGEQIPGSLSCWSSSDRAVPLLQDGPLPHSQRRKPRFTQGAKTGEWISVPSTPSQPPLGARTGREGKGAIPHPTTTTCIYLPPHSHSLAALRPSPKPQ